jgi:GNAT superfamily N-acetyltransferase
MQRLASRVASILSTIISSATPSPTTVPGSAGRTCSGATTRIFPELPRVLGLYTLSMAVAESAPIAKILEAKLPRYPMPVALIGRLAIDLRAQGRRLGETLLIDALRRVVDAAGLVGCTGIIVDAKDDTAERFYAKYDFVTISAETWPHRMFLPLATARSAFAEP